MQMIDLQHKNEMNPDRVGEVPSSTRHTPPPIITKKWLAWRYGCIHPCGKFNYARLYRLVLKEEVLIQIGYTPETVKGPGVQEFDAVASAKLIKILSL